eukprot:750722-Hanusia_phi.AAC.5
MEEEQTKRRFPRLRNALCTASFLVAAVAVVFASPLSSSMQNLQSQGRGLLSALGLRRAISSGLAHEEVLNTSRQLEKLPIEQQPVEIFKWVNATFKPTASGPSWVQFTSFGPQGLVITDMLREQGLLDHTRVVSIDTHYLFPETYALIEDATKHFGIEDKLRIYKSKEGSRAMFEKAYGEKLWKVDLKLFEFLTKVEPTRRALEDLGVKAWITGRRKSQGGARRDIPLVEIDGSDGRIKINPLANWDMESVWKYIKERRLPYNSLHDDGFQSIGDVFTTERTKDGESEREGRWRQFQGKTECGMHLSNDSGSYRDLVRRSERVKKGYLWDFEASKRALSLGISLVSSEKFEEVVWNCTEDVFIDIYAPWCPHCQSLDPDFNELAKTVKERGINLKLARMDGWQNKIPESISDKFHITGFPSLFLVLKGSAQ